MDDEDVMKIGVLFRAEYNPDCDETDEITVTNIATGDKMVFSPNEAMRLGKFAQERQARYS